MRLIAKPSSNTLARRVCRFLQKGYAPASRAYLYYTDEHKHWVDGLSVTITAKN